MRILLTVVVPLVVLACATYAVHVFRKHAEPPDTETVLPQPPAGRGSAFSSPRI